MKDLIEKGAFLVDVRTPEEFAEGHVNASMNIPLDELPNRMEEFNGKENIIVFCRSGARSGMAKSILNQAGFENVLNGGPWTEIKALID